MLTKKITYEDYNGNKRTDEFCFNINKAELLEMEMSAEGGMEKMLNRMINAQDSKQLMAVFKKIVLMAYGKKSEDGIRFIKTKSMTEEFEQTDAFSELIMELASDENAITAFITGIIPQSLAAQIAEHPELVKKLPQ